LKALVKAEAEAEAEGKTLKNMFPHSLSLGLVLQLEETVTAFAALLRLAFLPHPVLKKTIPSKFGI